MFRATVLAVCLTVATEPVGIHEAHADAEADCRGRDTAMRISGCTALTKSGKSNKQTLSGAHLDRGHAYYRKKAFSEALSDYDNAIKLDPRYVEA